MEAILSQVLDCLSQANPLYAIVALGLWYVFGGTIRGLLARIPLPKLSPAVPDKPVDPLEDHPLLDLIWERVKAKFAEKDASVDMDDLYVKVVKALKEIQ